METDPIVEQANRALASGSFSLIRDTKPFAEWIVRHATIVAAAKAQQEAADGVVTGAPQTSHDLYRARWATEAAVRAVRAAAQPEKESQRGS